MIDISVVIPTYNRKIGLNSCIRSLINQRYPHDRFEIIVIDDGSRYSIKDALKVFENEFGNLRFAAQNHKGPAAARNLGVSISCGSIVAFIDDDCEAAPDWLSLMVQAHKEHPSIVAVGGYTLTSNQKTSVIVGQFLSTCSIETNLQGRSEVIFFPTCNVSCKRTLFSCYKFNEDFPLPGGEDLEFFWRLFKDDYRFRWEKDIKVIHYRDDSFLSFARQSYIYGRGNFLVKYIHDDHPLLKELHTGYLSFCISTLVNFLKIPRFSFLLSRRLICEYSIKDAWKKISVSTCFVIHKIFYLLGNCIEFLKVLRGKERAVFQIAHVPRLLILDITHACNLHCRICDIWKTSVRQEDIETSLIKNVLQEARDLGIKEIALSGGESLLRNDIFNIFDHAKRISIENLGVLSNGVIVKDYFDKLKPYLLDRTISLVISLDSLSQDLHNEIRNSADAWQKTRESLDLLSVLKRAHPQVNFNIITIVLNQNLEELYDLAVFVRSLGANSLQFQALLPNNLRMAERKDSEYWIAEDRMGVLRDVLGRLIELKKAQPDFIKNSVKNLSLIEKYYQGRVTSRDAQCASAYDTVLISNKGECRTCFSAYGDIKRKKLKDIFASKERTLAKERVAKCSWPCLLPCFCDQ